MLASAFNAYGRGDLVEARRIAAAILKIHCDVDPWSSVDAEHIMARSHYDEKNLAEAEATLLRVLFRSEQLGYSDGFVRALHEISRVKAQKCEPLDAEAGFRVALEFYSLRALASRRSGDTGPVHDSDLRNIQSSINSLSALAETYFLLSNGPTEGSRLLRALHSDLFADDQTGDDFLEIRGLALWLLTKEAREHHAANLLAVLWPCSRSTDLYQCTPSTKQHGMVSAAGSLTPPSFDRFILNRLVLPLLPSAFRAISDRISRRHHLGMVIVPFDESTSRLLAELDKHNQDYLDLCLPRLRELLTWGQHSNWHASWVRSGLPRSPLR
jgi:hypothetical protein